MTSRAAVDQFLSRKHIALAGASRSGKRFGCAIVKELSKKGFSFSLLHPEADEIMGHRCFQSMSDLPDDIDSILLVVPPEQTINLVREVAKTSIKNIWMQQGSESAEAIEFCAENGITVVSGECILMFADPGGLHKFHHWLWGLFGKLPKEGS
ncbi:CoA-binding protein [Candidatus Zixiibacteriota bacterium]